LTVWCKNPAGGSNSYEVHRGYWGDWKGEVKFEDNYVCGAQTRFEGNQGEKSDDTALNGIKLRFCPLKKLRSVDFAYDEKNLMITQTPKTVK
jgi:hypothetical protein